MINELRTYYVGKSINLIYDFLRIAKDNAGRSGCENI